MHNIFGLLKKAWLPDLTQARLSLHIILYLLLISKILSLQITNFFESTLHDVFVSLIFSSLKKSSFFKWMILLNFPI